MVFMVSEKSIVAKKLPAPTSASLKEDLLTLSVEKVGLFVSGVSVTVLLSSIKFALPAISFIAPGSTSSTTAPPLPPVTPDLAKAAIRCASVNVIVIVVASESMKEAPANVTSSVPVTSFK